MSLIHNSKAFNLGILLMVSFFAIFYFIMFVPAMNGKTTIIYADDMFNSLAKGSTNFIPKYMKKTDKFMGQPLDVTFKMKKPEEAEKAAGILSKNGVNAVAQAEKVTVTGADLGKTLMAAETDSDLLFNDKGEEVAAKYGFNEKEALFLWHGALGSIKKELEKQSRFDASLFLDEVISKVVEPGYNFYGIKSEKVKDHVGMLVGFLTFYVIYTLWFGYSIYELFNGIGLTMTKSKAKKE